MRHLAKMGRHCQPFETALSEVEEKLVLRRRGHFRVKKGLLFQNYLAILYSDVCWSPNTHNLLNSLKVNLIYFITLRAPVPIFLCLCGWTIWILLRTLLAFGSDFLCLEGMAWPSCLKHAQIDPGNTWSYGRNGFLYFQFEPGFFILNTTAVLSRIWNTKREKRKVNIYLETTNTSLSFFMSGFYLKTSNLSYAFMGTMVEIVWKTLVTLWLNVM